MLRRTIAWVALVLALFACVLPARTRAAPGGVQKRVLVLHQLRLDSPVSVAMEDVYRRILGDALGSHLDYYSEYLDLYRFPEAEARATLRSYLRERYATRGLDVIIAPTTAALNVVRTDAEELFPGVRARRCGEPGAGGHGACAC